MSRQEIPPLPSKSPLTFDRKVDTGASLIHEGAIFQSCDFRLGLASAAFLVLCLFILFLSGYIMLG